jgi:hypothetical protein
MCRKRAARREWEMERKLEQSVRHGGESGLPLISEAEGATAVQLLHSPDIHKHPAAVSRKTTPLFSIRQQPTSSPPPAPSPPQCRH